MTNKKNKYQAIELVVKKGSKDYKVLMMALKPNTVAGTIMLYSGWYPTTRDRTEYKFMVGPEDFEKFFRRMLLIGQVYHEANNMIYDLVFHLYGYFIFDR